MKKTLYILPVAALLIACGGEEETTTTEEVEEYDSLDFVPEPIDPAVQIDRARVGTINIGDPITDTLGGYDQRVVKELRKFPGSEVTEDVYIYSKEGSDILKVYKSAESDAANPTIGEIVVLSFEYETAEGIDVFSTISDLAAQWPDGTFSYTPWNDEFSFYTKDHTARFILQNAAYLGEPLDPKGKEVVSLTAEDFDTEATIVSIWVLAK